MVASIEATLELWASSLREVKARLRPLFGQKRGAASATSFLDGLLGDERRKTGCMCIEAAGVRGHGDSSRSWGGVGGMRMPCVTLCATMRWSIWVLMMRC